MWDLDNTSLSGRVSHSCLNAARLAVRRASVARCSLTAGSRHRVLITDGTADTNVPVSTIKPLASALTSAGATRLGLRVLDGVNHFLHLPGLSDNTQVLAPSVVAALQDWASPFAQSWSAHELEVEANALRWPDGRYGRRRVSPRV